jgi:hypothetical protein
MADSTLRGYDFSTRLGRHYIRLEGRCLIHVLKSFKDEVDENGTLLIRKEVLVGPLRDLLHCVALCKFNLKL